MNRGSLAWSPYLQCNRFSFLRVHCGLQKDSKGRTLQGAEVNRYPFVTRKELVRQPKDDGLRRLDQGLPLCRRQVPGSHKPIHLGDKGV
jgi:hypothetical protein